MTEQLSDYQRELIETHVGLAQNIATRFWRRLPNVLDLDDVVAIAYQGLVTAAQRFDPSYRPPDDPKYDPRLAFGPFARTRITGAIQDWLRSRDHVPRRHRRLYKDIRDLGPGQTTETTAELLGVDPARVRAVVTAVETPPVSLTSVMEAQHSFPVADPHDTADSVVVQSVQDAVSAVIDDMADFEKSVIVLRYYMGLDFVRIATELEVSVSRVKEAHQEAVLLIHGVMIQAVTL